MEEIVVINGNRMEEGTPLRSLMYGEGLFETFRWKSQFPVFYDKHINRMREGARLLGIPFPIDEEMKYRLQKALSDADISDAYVKIALLSKGSSVFHEEPNGYSLLFVVRRYQPAKKSVNVIVSSYRRNTKSPILCIKSLNYLENLLAKREAFSSGHDEALYLNERNELAEGAVSNIFFIRDKVLYTPSVECGLLPGIIRGAIFEIVHELGLEIREGRYGLEELRYSDGVFLTSSLIGAVPVSSIDEISMHRDCEIFNMVVERLIAKLGWG